MAVRATRSWPGQLISRSLGIASRQATPAFHNSAPYTHPSSASRLFISSFHRSARFVLRTERSLISRQFRSLRFNSNKTSNSTPHPGNPEPVLSVSQRLKKLSREYGWTALGVYLALSALDLPFCFLAVRTLGADKIAHYEHTVIEKFWAVLRIPFPSLGKAKEQEETPLSPVTTAEATAREGEIVWSDQVEQVEALNPEANASIWTQLALAYVIHKSFIFVRVPITAAILPKVVKKLRGWGWDIGKRTLRPRK